MAETKHTPGPWTIGGESTDPRGRVVGYAVETADGALRIATVEVFEIGDEASEKEAVADARLIAAAPDLLEALQRFYDEGRGYSDETWAAMKRAIAKAKGRADG